MKKIFSIILILLTVYAFSNDKPIPASFFGIHIHKVLKKDKPWPTVPFKTWRLWDTGIAWPEIQPERDTWKFELIDKAVKLSEEHNVELVINIGLSPQWAAARPKDKSGYGEKLTASEPKNIEDWKAYVRTLAERYKGKIRYWEIWNEPDMRLFFSGSTKSMVELTKTAYEILKEVDPENMIISPPVTGYLVLIPWLKSYFRDGGGDYIDIIGTHFYVWFKSNDPEKVVSTINMIKEYANEFGIKGKPIWDTECGFKQQNVTNEDLAMGYIARLAIVQWYYGVERVMYYSWDNNYIIRMVDKEYKNETHVAVAYRETQKWLIGAIVKDMINVGNNVWIARLERNGKEARMIWHSNDTNPDFKIDYTIPEEWRFLSKIKNLYSEVFDISENRNIKIGVSPLMLYDDGFFNEK